MSSLPPSPTTPPAIRVLLVSPDAELRQRLRGRLSAERWHLREAGSGAEALETLMESTADVLLLDTRLPDLRPAELRGLVTEQFPDVQLLILDGEAGESATPRDGDLLGELNSLLHLNPFQELHSSPGSHSPRLPASLSDSRLFSGHAALPGPAALRPSAAPRHGAHLRGWHGMIGDSEPMQRVYHAARLVARRDTSVLITGESGTGKDLVARAIHLTSTRDKQPFVVINCAAIPEALLEAELFGYTKGAFTGAIQSRIGRIHAAHGGTLFLDEIGDMPLALQSKLLRFLEQGEVQRIGGGDTLKVDVRVIAATNADLKKLASQSLFREDLYYRLAVFPIRLPPLRERMDDLDGLIHSFLMRFSPGLAVRVDAHSLLHQHSWPGNVRELRNVLERASLFAEAAGEIRPEDILL